MKTQVWVYVVVAVLSLGAGVAIAGVPTFEERDPTIQSLTESTTTTTTIEAQLSESPESTTEPASDDDDAATGAVDSETSTTEGVAATTTSTSTTSTSTTTTTSTSTTTTTTLPPAAKDTLRVAVANGAYVGGAATNGSNALEDAGYVNVGSFDGLELRDVTILFAAGGLQSEAERLAEEIGVDIGLIFPIETAPGVDSLDENVQILVYLGRDVVDLPFFN